jgi:hypothetical protein
MRNIPNFVRKLLIALPNVYLWRVVSVVIPLFAAGVGIALSVLPSFARIVF